VTFTAFAPNTFITSSSDILSICVNMEHSFAGDLGFRIICPNGQSVQLDPNTHSGGAYLGEPYGGANHSTYDNGCLPENNPFGVGWTYCWSQIYPTHGTMDQLSSAGVSPIDSTNTISHTNYIQPSNSLSGLIGCPLNGTWNIQICDDYAIDNGYIFWWKLNIDPSLLPESVPIDSIECSGPFIHKINDSVFSITPESGGLLHYLVKVTNTLGNYYDTSFNLIVVQTPVVDLGHDTTVCANNFNNMILHAGTGMSAYAWNTGWADSTLVITTGGLYSVTVTNVNVSNTLQCTDRDSIYIKELASPIVDLGPDMQINEIINPIYLDAGNPGFQYFWSTGATTQTITVTELGLYCVTVAEEIGQGCDVVDCIYFGPDAFIGETEFDKYYHIYPNPAIDNVFIQALDKNGDSQSELEIYNTQGTLLIKHPLIQPKTEVNISKLAIGLYYIRIEIKDGIIVGKFVKE
jgi:hypothetical protein